MKNIFCALLCCVLAAIQSNSQSMQRCVTDLYHFNKGIVPIRHIGPAKLSDAVYQIPVVVHVVYGEAEQNICDEQILSQIEVLNRDFRKQNNDTAEIPEIYSSLAADIEIEFCLATRDPQGNATTGITRTFTDVTEFGTDNDMKSAGSGGTDPWPSQSYLNIWVCNLAGDVLGFATYPGGSSSEDGVVLSYKAFGNLGTASYPYNEGRTAVHEIGHWLNLYHIWGDDGGTCFGTDNVDDTPNQANANYGCAEFPSFSCDNDGDMSMNYMDYSDDDCLLLFTHGQRDRMRSAIENLRPEILTSSGCSFPPLFSNAQFFITVYPNPTNGLLQISVYDESCENYELSIYNMIGQQFYQVMVTTVSTDYLVNLGSLDEGMYVCRLVFDEATYALPVLLKK